VWRWKKGALLKEEPSGPEWDPPNVSVLIAVKNEEPVARRLLEALTSLDYPRENLEIVVVEDESNDRTLEICEEFAHKFPFLKVFHRDTRGGKADALNFAFRKSKGEIIALFDADDVPERECLKKMLRYFDRPQVGAVYGRHKPLNFNESLLSKLMSCETFLYGVVNYAKYTVGLFVSFSGSNLYLRRSALERVGLWDARLLIEDVDLAVRFARNGILTRLAPIDCYDESPAKILPLVKQRLRWSGGNFQVGVKHWDCWREMPWIKALDTSILTMSPVFSMLLLSGWVLGGLGAFRIGVSLELVRPLLAGLMALAFVLTGTAAAAVLMQVRSNRVSYVKMILATYPYAALITLASAAGMILVATGMGRKMWFKTPKTGFRDQRWEAGT
jgi:cellulose synthase/poly-beta-1,6-N-acetylglucosamine synthase-like glycosyltransferase